MMKTPSLTVIIPTYNRSSILDECLSRLYRQSLSKDDYEVIVVNDGSSDKTKDILNSWEKKWSSLSAIHQKNAGQGSARNRGIKQAKGNIVLFIGDDIYADEKFLETHLNFHKSHSEVNMACLGLSVWDPSKPINAYMKWLVHGGPQFSYHKLKSGNEASFWYFYTSNISLKKSLLDQGTFSSEYKGYGWEDIELAYRLFKSAKLKIIFIPEALAYHDHLMKERDLKKRMISIGKNSYIFQKQHPELNIVPTGIKKFSLNIIGSLPVRLILGALKYIIPYFGKRFYWYALSKHYFMQGIRSV